MQSKTWKTLAGVGAFVATLAGGAVMVPGAGASTGVQVSSPSRSTALPDVVGVPAVSSQGIVPPQNPSKSLPPAPNFSDDGSCKSNALDNSQTCNADVVKAVDNARTSLESMSALSLNLSAYEDMTVPQQLFAMTNLERTERGLAPIAGLTTQLDSMWLRRSANDNSDPEHDVVDLDGRGHGQRRGRSIWAGGTSNALGSDYYWMYDDGPNSPNSDHVRPSNRGPAAGVTVNVILGTFATCATGRAVHGRRRHQPPAHRPVLPSPRSSSGPAGRLRPTWCYTWAQAEKALERWRRREQRCPPRTRDVKAVPAKKGVTAHMGRPVPTTAARRSPGTRYSGVVHRSGAETPYTKVACTASSVYLHEQERAGQDGCSSTRWRR
jgi:hypothetical protein